jgi:hypothetical protein
MGRSDSCSSVPDPLRLHSRAGTRSLGFGSLRRTCPSHRRRPGPGLRWAHAVGWHREMNRPPRFLGEPRTLAPLYDPGPARPSGDLDGLVLPATAAKASARTTSSHFGAQSRSSRAHCVRFTASVTLAAQHSLLSGSPAQTTGLQPAGSLSKVSVWLTSSFTRLVLAHRSGDLVPLYGGCER